MIKTYCVSCGSRINPKNYKKYGNYCIGECKYAKNNLDFEKVKLKIERYFGVDDLFKNTRKKDYIEARSVLIYFLHTKKISNTDIARMFNKDKSTISYLINTMDFDSVRYILDML